MGRRYTFDDIARLANVSKSTVSKAFSGASDVSAETRRLVFDAAEKLSYIKKDKGRLKRIGFLVQNTDFSSENDFGFTVLNSFRKAAFLNNYEVIPLNFDGDKNTPVRYADMMEKHKLLGAFIVGLDAEHTYVKELKSTPYCTVTLDNYTATDRVSCVSTDSVKGMMEAVGYLVSLGHTRIGLLNGTRVSPVSTQRLYGYVLGLETNGIPYDERLVQYQDYDFKCDRAVAEAFRDSGVTAVACGCDKLAMGFITALKELGLRVPDDVSVVGFDNIQFCKYFVPALTTVAQDQVALGEAAFYALYDLMNGRKGVNVSLEPALIVRESCRNLTDEISPCASLSRNDGKEH